MSPFVVPALAGIGMTIEAEGSRLKPELQAVGLIISLFPGIGLLDLAFELEGLPTVRGPDLLWGGDIRHYHLPRGCCWGIIGGPPCQDFSQARRAPPTGEGEELMREFARCVIEARPDWFLLENVPRAPSVIHLAPGLTRYKFQRFDVNQGWYCDVSRLRHFQFGSLDGTTLQIPRGEPVRGKQRAALANDDRSVSELLALQGLPPDFKLPGLSTDAKKRAIGNGVPIQIGRELARAIRTAYRLDVVTGPALCECGCGRGVQGKARYASPACRKAAQRKRDRAGIKCDTAAVRFCRCGCGRLVRGKHLYDSPACRKRAQRARALRPDLPA